MRFLLLLELDASADEEESLARRAVGEEGARLRAAALEEEAMLHEEDAVDGEERFLDALDEPSWLL